MKFYEELLAIQPDTALSDQDETGDQVRSCHERLAAKVGARAVA